MSKTIGLALVLLALAAPAQAQLYGSLYFGTNNTQAADIEISQPSRDTTLTFRDVEFDARPFTAPQYYGVRIGYFFGEARRYGTEVELIHLKVIGRTEETYEVSGRVNGQSIGPTPIRMDTLVQRYSMTHGLNFLLVNFVARRPLGESRVALMGRAGAGPTYPHAETTVGNLPQEQYEIAGLGVHVSAGVDVKLASWLSAMSEYKLTLAQPKISIADGTGQMWATSHQLAFGLAFGVSR
jgi:hypothetical protein